MNHEQNRAESERRVSLKDIGLERWRQLPAEHQASLGLVLVSSIVDGEWGTWFRDALSSRFDLEHAEGMGVLRPITHADLQEVGLSQQEIGQLTDDDLSKIAKMITDHWTQDVFRDDLLVIAEMVLEGKHKP